MNTRLTRVTQFAILSLLLIGIGIASSSSAAAQRRGRNWDGYPNWGGGYQLRETALNAGYNEGLRAGRDDRRHGRYNPSRSINSMKDYNSRMGDRYTYQQYFVQAFQNGYADGYRGA